MTELGRLLRGEQIDVFQEQQGLKRMGKQERTFQAERISGEKTETL